MPAPTALQRAPDTLAIEQTLSDAPHPTMDEDILITTDQPTLDPASSPSQPPPADVMDTEDATALFAPEPTTRSTHRVQERKIRIPPHRLTPLKTLWPKIYPPLVEHLHLQIRMNLPKKTVELRTSRHHSTGDPGAAIQKGADFLQAFCLGFDLDDAIALLRLDDLYIQTFEIKDVKALSGEHLSRAVGRIAGKDGKTKFAIENASRTRIVLAEQKVHILGGFQNLHVARTAVVSLILGSPPGKVYGDLRTVGARMKERF
ncbi:pre-rRNA-processing protein pno1 [Friedmanniomyces endolithicus]|uniref:Pre-rRNA-processing protein PNO1 n=1 Tax=Friedmanniomyces endolithicus TaxID=329885 RepID=A0AAN6JIV0_9PEZI|nr:pre-rRNA-processing protein pno1 [Friedmanniomyces endolithicus]